MKEAVVVQLPVSAWRASEKEHKSYTASLWAETVGQDLQNTKQEFCLMTNDVQSSRLQDDHLHSYLLSVLT
jgi:CRISPR/Cas system-associated protein Cas10 (large subunit of type III CRISPR-Cas system)